MRPLDHGRSKGKSVMQLRGVRRPTWGVRPRLLAAMLSGVVVATGLGLVGAAPVQALNADQQPQFLRSIGGQGRPGVFAWGIQHNPVTNEILVGDYLNYKVRRYDTQGNPLGDFFRTDRLGQPYSIAVDPNDGDIYVAELKDNPLTASIVKYDKFGNYLYDADATLTSNAGNRFRAFYPVWMTVEEDTGNLLVLDSHYQNLKVGVSLNESNPPRVLTLKFNDDTQTVDELGAFDVNPPDAQGADKPRLYGIDIADDDRIYMSDAWNARAYIYSKTGEQLATFGETQTGGDNRGVVVDEDTDKVYLVDAIHSQVDVFDRDGTYLDSFSREGTRPGEFSGGGRQIDIDGDGNVWVADYGGFEAEKFAPDGTPLLRAPDPARRPPVGLLAQPRDVAIDDQTGEVWVADSWAQRFQRFSPTGASMGAWGNRGAGGDFDMNYPRHIAIQPATATTPKRIWVVNERGHHLKIYNYPTSATGSPTFVRQLGDALVDNTTAGHFRWPGDIEFSTRPDGRQVAIITDRMAASVKVLDAVTFEEIDMTPGDNDPDKNYIPVTSNGTAVDPVTGNIFIGNGTKVVVHNQAGTKLSEFGTAGTGPGQFRDIADLVTCNGQVYVADEAASKISVFTTDGTYVTRWGSTYGSNPGDFKGPAGLDCDAQKRVYVTDSGNDRIQVFSTVNPRSNDAVAPSAPVVTAPAQSAVLPLAPVTITGTATDNVSVGQVELVIQDADTGKYWDSSDSSWESAKTTSLAAWTSTAAPATSVSWRFDFAGVSAKGRYVVEVRTRDHGGTQGPSVMRTFAMTGATAPAVPPAPVHDTTRPDGTLSFPVRSPTTDAPLGPVHLVGNATDDTGVTSVRVAIKRNSDGRWWNGTGTTGFGTAYTGWDTTLAQPGEKATGWSWTWTPKAAGAYTVIVEARDAAGNIDGSKPSVPFNVTTDAPGTEAAETVITSPTDGSTMPAGRLNVTGSASDDRAVAAVRVEVQDSQDRWWNGFAFVDTPSALNATVTGVGTPAATWSYAFTGGVDGATYRVTATATDGTGRSDASPATSTVLLSGAPDTTAPTVSVTSPAGGATVPLPSVSITGTAADGSGVDTMRIGIQDTATKKWWTGSGWGSFGNVPVTVDQRGATSTSWSYTFTPPAGGTFGYQAWAFDVAGNQSTKTAWRTVKMQ